MTDQTQISTDNSGHLLTPVLCCRCQYALRGLATDAVCPECATPVERSLSARLLCFASTSYLRRVRIGLTLTVVWLLSQVLWSYLRGEFLFFMSPGLMTTVNGVLLALGGVALVLLLTPRYGASDLTPMEDRRRSVARWGYWLGLLTLAEASLIGAAQSPAVFHTYLIAHLIGMSATMIAFILAIAHVALLLRLARASTAAVAGRMLVIGLSIVVFAAIGNGIAQVTIYISDSQFFMTDAAQVMFTIMVWCRWGMLGGWVLSTALCITCHVVLGRFNRLSRALRTEEGTLIDV